MEIIKMIHFCVKFKKENASIAADSRMASGTFGCPKFELVAESANQRNSQILFWFQSLSEFQSLSFRFGDCRNVRKFRIKIFFLCSPVRIYWLGDAHRHPKDRSFECRRV